MRRRLFIGYTICNIMVTAAAAQSSHAVRGYVRRDGTYVAPHRATNPNNTRLDNWSTKGNFNPDSGKPGTVDPYRSPQSASIAAPDRGGSAF